MKIRNGFVSNSSSSSFILISKEINIPNAPRFRETFKDDRGRTKKYWEHLTADASVEGCYNRNDIKRLNTIEEKIIYLIHLYAYYYQETKPIENYFFKLSDMKAKLQGLGKKRGYALYIKYPALCGEEDKSIPHIPHSAGEKVLYTWVNVSTECTYVKQIVDLMEKGDTTNLESFIFNPHSFALLGGDEYEETYKLMYKAKREVVAAGYPYERIADYPDVEKGTCEWDPEYEYHWGEYEYGDAESTKAENEEIVEEKTELLNNLYIICEKRRTRIKEDPFILDKSYARGASMAYGDIMQVIKEMKTSIRISEKAKEEERLKYEEEVNKMMNTIKGAFSKSYFTLEEDNL